MNMIIKYTVVFLLSLPLALFSQEICNNGIDDDNDGLIDLQDDECACEGFGSSQNVPSLIPNFSFEDHSCCPSGYSQLNCADTWMQASGNTSDYFNTCGFNDPFSANPFPLPGGGSGYAGFIDGYSDNTYKEYIGACLINPMVAGTQYSLTINVAHATGDNNLNFVIYGSNSCTNLPFSGICPTTGWDVLSTIPLTFTTKGQWELVTFTFVPTQNINAIIFGGDCNPHPLGGTGPYNYYYIDEMILAETSLFSSIDITPAGSWCANNIVLTASSDSIGSWQWYKDSIALVGETNAILNVSSNNYGMGNYTVRLMIGSKCETITYTVNPPDIPVPNFEFDSVCHNLVTNFTDISTTSTGSVVTWEWDFGDGTTSLLNNPTHTYTQSGTFTTKLVVTSDIGCKDSITKQVLVYPNPLTIYTVDDVCLDDVSVFQNTSTISNPDNIATYTWMFGDGTTSNANNPTHTYLTEGTFNVKLITQSNHGCLDSSITTTRIHPKPTAAFTVNDDCSNIAAQFTNNSTISSGTISNWKWDFGDATPLNTNQNPSHFYSTAGTYQVSLIAISDKGCTNLVTNPTIRHAIPLVNFTATPACVYDSISFVNATTIQTPSTITNYIWNFGDGSSFSTITNPKHKFTNSGIYNISLIASSSFGCVSDISMPIQVFPKPVANFSNTSVCENKPPMYFIDISTVGNGNISTWKWNFGDGNTDNFQLPSNNYTTAGTYTVQLIVTSNNGCLDTIENPVVVDPKPTAAFSVDITEGCSPVCVSFTDNSVSNSTINNGWQWNLGNGEGSFDANPTTCYINPSNTTDLVFNTSLIVKNDKGCYDTIQQNNLITSWHNPLAQFEASPIKTNMYEANITTFNATLGANSYAWNFDNSTTSTDFEPIVSYTDTGTYHIVLAVATLNNCVDTARQTVKVTPVTSIYIPNTFTPNGDGVNDGFIYHGFGINESTAKFYIFDRWGALIYYTENGTPWDGTYKGEIAMQDTYVYRLSCKDVLGKIHDYTGHFSLLK